jgi:hypothetical protein
VVNAMYFLPLMVRIGSNSLIGFESYLERSINGMTSRVSSDSKSWFCILSKY